MNFLSALSKRAVGGSCRLVFPEGDDARVQSAAARLALENIARPVLLNGAGEGCVPVKISESGELLEKYTAALHEKRRHKGMTPEQARKLVSNPLYFGCMMVASGDADGFVGGAANTTAETIRAALACIGISKGATLSSFFFMETRQNDAGEGGLLMFADCAVNIDPDPTQLAGIAAGTADSWKLFTGTEPRVALLSFSTMGSAGHAHVTKVRDALAIIKRDRPDIACDGEMQADAALVPSIGKRKAPKSAVAGRANVLIFPDLDSGNIGYKLVQRLGAATVCGPILQGLAMPANDLSRGAEADEIFHTGVVTALQAQRASSSTRAPDLRDGTKRNIGTIVGRH